MNSDSFEQIAAQLFACERALLDPSVRQDRAQVAALLAEDFVEIGASGRVWTREELLDLLETQNFEPPEVEDMACRVLGDGVMLVTYRIIRFDAGKRSTALRSSIWSSESGNWMIRFHQGTRID